MTMLYFLSLIFLTAGLILRMRNYSAWNFIRSKGLFEESKLRYLALSRRNLGLRQKNAVLGIVAEENIQLFEITREISKYLEEEKVFSAFRKSAGRYLALEDCKFLKSLPDGQEYRSYQLQELHIDKRSIGYLAVKGLGQAKRYKYDILLQQFSLGVKRAVLYQQVQELSVSDSLTQVSNRRYLLARLKEEIHRSARFRYNFSFLMLDIDFFKQVNDKYGHLVGDAVLREAAKVIRESVRQMDLVGRYGGEEFGVVLPETDKKQAAFAAERIRRALEEKRIRAYDEELKVTASIGSATYPDHAKSIPEMIEIADQALYRAKEQGRNRVACA